MLTIARLDTIIKYLVFAIAAVMGFSRGGIHTAVLLLILLAVVRFVWKPYHIPVETDIKRAMAVFFSALLLSSLFSGDMAASLKFLGLSLTRMLPFFIVLAFIDNKKAVERNIYLMSGSLLIGAMAAVWQASQGQLRVKSFLGIMDFAGAIGLIVPVLLVKSFDRDARPWTRYLCMVSMVAAMIALIFNGTRAVWVSVLVTFLLFILLNVFVSGRKSLKLVAVTAVVLLGVLLLAFSSTTFTDRLKASTFESNSIHKRILVWNYAWDQFKEHWFLGRGLATLPTFSAVRNQVLDNNQHYPYGHVHNNFLQMLAENGIVGGLAYAYLFFSIYKTALKRLKTPATRNWALIALLCTTDFLVHGMFDYTFTIATIMYSYWFILGLAYGSFRLSAQEGGFLP